MSDINVILAERNGLGAVRLCECKSIHLSVGPVTINMAVEVFAQTATLIRQAMETLAVIVASGELDQEQTAAFPHSPSPMTH
jgi:hypothetical protein